MQFAQGRLHPSVPDARRRATNNVRLPIGFHCRRNRHWCSACVLRTNSLPLFDAGWLRPYRLQPTDNNLAPANNAAPKRKDCLGALLRKLAANAVSNPFLIWLIALLFPLTRVLCLNLKLHTSLYILPLLATLPSWSLLWFSHCTLHCGCSTRSKVTWN